MGHDAPSIQNVTNPSSQWCCDLCQQTNAEIISRLDRKSHSLETVVCRKCGLVSHHDIPTDEQLTEYYSKTYRKDYHGEITPSARRVMRAWKNGRRIYRQLAPSISTQANIFEVGAGIGCTVKAFELAGHDASGVDPNVGFQQYSQTELHARIDCAGLFDLPAEPRHDVVLLIHVIEHFNSPRKALCHIHEIIQPNGMLYVECPNIGAPFARRSRMFHFAHVHNFTPATLEMMARRCGFSLQHDFTTSGDPNLQMLFKREEGGELRIESGSYRATIDALRRYNALTYHARWKYVWPRIRKLASYATEHLVARGFTQKVLAKCKNQATQNNARLTDSQKAA